MKKWTVVFIIAIIVLIAIYDVFAITTSGTEASISSVIINWSYEFPAFTFLTGLVTGHLFWRMKPNKETKKKGM